MAVLFSIASCQKNEEFSNFCNEQQAATCKVDRLDNFNLSRDVQPNPFLLHLDTLFGDLYCVTSDSLKSCFYSNSTHGNVTIWAFPFKYFNVVPSYLAVVFKSSSNIVGVYNVTYLGKHGNNSDSYTYEYSIYDFDVTNDMPFFTGSVTLFNIYPAHPDVLRIDNNSINIPSTYPYAIFDNISYGNVELETLITLYSNERDLVTLRMAATFYENYY